MHRLLRPAAICCGLVAAGSLLSCCGNGGAASAANATTKPTTPVSKAQAVAYAHAVNLTTADVPGMTSEGQEGEFHEAGRSSVEFARCYGGVSPALQAAEIRSPLFFATHGRESQLVWSRVEVWPTPALAARSSAAYLSPRGGICA